MSKIADPVRKQGGSDGMPGMEFALRSAGAEEVLTEAQSANTHQITLGDVFRFVVVSLYLGAVLLYLIVTLRVNPLPPIRPFRRRAYYATLDFCRRCERWAGLRGIRRRLVAWSIGRIDVPRTLTEISAESGHCYSHRIDHRILSDSDRRSRLQLYENGIPLPHAHAALETIRKDGMGAFLHWDDAIYFSSADNSDPRSNGRTYTCKEI